MNVTPFTQQQGDDYPALAGQKRTIGALRAALAATL